MKLRHFFSLFCLTLTTLALPQMSCSGGTDTFPGLPGPNPDQSASLKADQPDWYQDGVFYHVWLKAFADSNRDGIGDLNGVTAKLDYLAQDLGVTGLWLSPHYKTASSLPNLHGYDVLDHYKVDPRFGTNDDLKNLLKEAHRRGLSVIFDFVPDFVSSKHKWFQDALGNRDGKRDWFLFRPDKPVAGWTGNDKRSDWYITRDKQYFYSAFWDQMPALNYRNPAVRSEMGKVVRYWLDFGFDGVRVDAIRYLYINEKGAGLYSDQVDQPETLAFVRALRTDLLDPYTKLGYPKFMVAENWTSDQKSLRAYLGTPEAPAFQLTFDFNSPSYLPRKVEDPTSIALDEWWEEFSNQLPVGGLATFLSNHDNVASRPASRLNGNTALQRSTAALQLTGPGVPFLYYGNEIGQKGLSGNDIDLRGDFDWQALAAQKAEPNSVFSVWKDLVALRKTWPALTRGTVTIIPSEEPTLFAFTRQTTGQKLLVIHNLSEDRAQEPTALVAQFPGAKRVYGPPVPLPPNSLGLWELP